MTDKPLNLTCPHCAGIDRIAYDAQQFPKGRGMLALPLHTLTAAGEEITRCETMTGACPGSELLGNLAPAPVHEWDGPTGTHFRDVRSETTGIYYHDTTPPEVVRALDSAYQSKASVRLFYGDTATGRDWCEENDVKGARVGASTGPLKTALLIATKRSWCGGGILTDCIVRMLTNGNEVYRHPAYQLPQFQLRDIAETETVGETNLRAVGYTVAVDRIEDGKTSNQANFKKRTSAQRYVQFMRGERASK